VPRVVVRPTRATPAGDPNPPGAAGPTTIAIVPFPRELLTNDEEVLVDLRPHWWYITPAGAYLAVAMIVGIWVLVSAGDNAGWTLLKFIIAIAVLAALVNFGQRYARWITTNFVVTNERVISRHGVIGKQGIEIPLDRINTVFFHQSVFERIVGAGDLGIESAGEQGRQTFSDIRRPNVVHQEIYRQKEEFEQRRIDSMGRSFGANQYVPPAAPTTPAPPPAASVPMQQAPGVPSITDQIEQLDRLRKQGVLTDEEFQAKKTELLRRL
jgi:membrane protein YdbS with pleckstrin-like domain